MNVHDKLKRAFRQRTGVRLTEGDVKDLIIGDVAIRDALYPDFDVFVSDRDRMAESGDRGLRRRSDENIG